MTKSVEPDKNAGRIDGEFRLDGDERSIWEAIDDIMRHVPEEVLRRLPVDGAEQHDHYLYESHGKAPGKS
ncbi:MAG TPA: hypothetical protein VF703_03920 [Pyrinomonadaceae bacterium]|jgi:hypothetical protein